MPMYGNQTKDNAKSNQRTLQIKFFETPIPEWTMMRCSFVDTMACAEFPSPRAPARPRAWFQILLRMLTEYAGNAPFFVDNYGK